MAVGDPHRHARPPGRPRIGQRQPLEQVQMHHMVPLPPEQRQKLPVVFHQAPLPARQLEKPNPQALERLGEHAPGQAGRGDIHLHPFQVQPVDHIAQEGFDSARFPSLAKTAYFYFFHPRT